MTSSTYVRASSKQLDLIIDQANQRLNAQNTFAQAADQRASLLTGANAALCVAAVGVLAQSLTANRLIPLSVGAVVAMIGFGIATWLAMSSAKCADFHPSGFYPKDFISDIRGRISLHQIRSVIAEIYDERIEFNGKTLVWRGKRADLASTTMFVTPIVSALAALAVYTLRHHTVLVEAIALWITYGLWS